MYINIFQSKALQNLPKWFENKQSGNPATRCVRTKRWKRFSEKDGQGWQVSMAGIIFPNT
jgi:hypothetical protein